MDRERKSWVTSKSVGRSNRYSPSPARPVPIQGYDPESGQIYQETIVRFPAKQSLDWIGEYKTPNILGRSQPHERGSRSLFEMAKSRCAVESKNFAPEYFSNVPWSVADALWSEITMMHRESFRVWRVFAEAYNSSEEFGRREMRYHVHIRQPALSLRDYYSGINSPSSKWLSALRISPRQISVPDLVAIFHITNLAVLDLSDGQLLLDNIPSPLDARIVRAWAELAAAKRGFKNLRVLMLGWQENISWEIFKYLDSFPSLQCLVTTDCRHMNQRNRLDWEAMATAHGWEAQHAKKSVKTLRPLLDDQDFRRGTITNCYYSALECSNESASALPLVECQLGEPRPWTHIMDEFPGTRTVWFTKARTEATEEKVVLEADQVKRTRGTGQESPSNPSPATKRLQNKSGARRKAPTQSAANLLADLAG